LWDPISKKPITKKGWWIGSRYRLGVQTPVTKKERKGKEGREGRERKGGRKGGR
jgi:hypothetical protein